MDLSEINRIHNRTNVLEGKIADLIAEIGTIDAEMSELQDACDHDPSERIWIRDQDGQQHSKCTTCKAVDV